MAVTKDSQEAKDHRINMAKQSFYDVDADLHELLDLTFGANDEDPALFIHLTVITQGTVISGKAVPRSAWAAHHAAAFDDVHTNISTALREKEAESEAIRKEVEGAGELAGLRGFINFKDARVWSGSTMFNVDSMRVSLRHVSAWSLGVFGTTKADES